MILTVPNSDYWIPVLDLGELFSSPPRLDCCGRWVKPNTTGKVFDNVFDTWLPKKDEIFMVLPKLCVSGLSFLSIYAPNCFRIRICFLTLYPCAFCGIKVPMLLFFFYLMVVWWLELLPHSKTFASSIPAGDFSVWVLLGFLPQSNNTPVRWLGNSELPKGVCVRVQVVVRWGCGPAMNWSLVQGGTPPSPYDHQEAPADPQWPDFRIKWVSRKWMDGWLLVSTTGQLIKKVQSQQHWFVPLAPFIFSAAPLPGPQLLGPLVCDCSDLAHHGTWLAGLGKRWR